MIQTIIVYSVVLCLEIYSLQSIKSSQLKRKSCRYKGILPLMIPPWHGLDSHSPSHHQFFLDTLINLSFNISICLCFTIEVHMRPRPNLDVLLVLYPIPKVHSLPPYVRLTYQPMWSLWS